MSPDVRALGWPCGHESPGLDKPALGGGLQLSLEEGREDSRAEGWLDGALAGQDRDRPKVCGLRQGTEWRTLERTCMTTVISYLGKHGFAI